MLLFLLISIAVPLFIYFLTPPLMKYLTGKTIKATPLLTAACVAYFISWYLPSPLIEGRDTSFTTHFVGGGVFCGFLWLYLKKSLGLKISAAAEALSLYAVVSALGVANELFELFIVKLNLVHHLSSADTWWDLLANTLGALFFYLAYRGTEYLQKSEP